tara:strand:- start:183 stop:449 length:267 start_codon:yes stop_codon:yes gene_type:complete
MIKELKYLFYLFFIFFFIFFTVKYYFSDDNEKNSYRLFQSIDKKNATIVANLSILESDTENIIEYVENNIDKNKKTYHFWKLLIDDEK